MKKIIYIEGMMCEHCKNRVENALLDFEGVKDVNVDLDTKKAEVELSKEISNEALKELIEDLGYEVANIE